MLPAGAGAARLARIVAFATPAGLLAGAYIGQYAFRLYPCEMCWWQRYPHFVALALGAIALARPAWRAPVVLAALAILISGLIGGFHAGVEYHWWQGITHCATTVTFGGDPLTAIMNAPNIRCDEAQWRLLGISLAGYNFLISCGAAALIAVLLTRSRSATP